MALFSPVISILHLVTSVSSPRNYSNSNNDYTREISVGPKSRMRKMEQTSVQSRALIRRPKELLKVGSLMQMMKKCFETYPGKLEAK